MSTIFWIWAAAMLIFLILELWTPTLVFACFVVGSLAAGIYSAFSPDEYYWQLGIFVAVSVVLLPATRSLARRITKPSPQKSNVDGMIGKVGLVTKAIDRDLGGHVKVEGETWQARAGSDIEADRKVRIVGVSGTKLHVERLEEEA